MDIAQVTVVVRTTSGQTHKAVFDAKGNCLSGDADILEAVAKATKKAKKSDASSSKSESKSSKPSTPVSTGSRSDSK
jgi:hypothetical protein